MTTLHVVALSGGKDSAAMALRLAELEPRDYTYVCTPTGDELPEMFQHWRGLAERLGKPLVPVMGGGAARACWAKHGPITGDLNADCNCAAGKEER